MCRIIFGGLNDAKNPQSLKFTPRQYFVLYGILMAIYICIYCILCGLIKGFKSSITTIIASLKLIVIELCGLDS